MPSTQHVDGLLKTCRARGRERKMKEIEMCTDLIDCTVLPPQHRAELPNEADKQFLAWNFPSCFFFCYFFLLKDFVCPSSVQLFIWLLCWLSRIDCWIFFLSGHSVSIWVLSHSDNQLVHFGCRQTTLNFFFLCFSGENVKRSCSQETTTAE